jgi:hypothetical protein
MLRTLINRAIIVLKVAETVCICPATPIETPNVMLISISRRLTNVPGGSSGAAEMINDSRVVFRLLLCAALTTYISSLGFSHNIEQNLEWLYEIRI